MTITHLEIGLKLDEVGVWQDEGDVRESEVWKSGARAQLHEDSGTPSAWVQPERRLDVCSLDDLLQ